MVALADGFGLEQLNIEGNSKTGTCANLQKPPKVVFPEATSQFSMVRKEETRVEQEMPDSMQGIVRDLEHNICWPEGALLFQMKKW